MTLRSFVQPVEAQGTTHVSGISRAAQQLEDVAPELVVGRHPLARLVVVRPLLGARQVQAHIAHRPHHRVELEERPLLLELALELVGPVGGAQTAPGHEVRARRNRRGRIDLEERQLPNDGDEVARPFRVEHLRPNCDPPRLRFR